MTETSRAQVAIVGGGPVGMGLAIELGQRGIETVVIERYPSLQPVPKGQNLTQRTMEHFHFWGVEPAIRAARTIPADYGIGGITAYGTLLSGYHYDWMQRELVRPYYFADNERLPQYATERVLRERATTLPAVSTLYGWTCEEASQDSDGVTLRVTESAGPGLREVRADYIVGCDGSRSTIREQAGISQTLSDHDKLMVLLVFKSEGLNRLLECFPGKSYYSVLHPVLKGYWQFFGRVDLNGTWFFHAPVPSEARDGEFDFVGYLHRAGGAEFDVEITYTGFWDLRFALANQYRQNRMFIAGDAAHSHPPYGGYGVNSGLEDARNLGWKLAARLQGWGTESLLDSYGAERHAVFQSTADDFIEKAIETDRRFLEAFDPSIDRDAFEAEWAARGSGARGEVAAFEPNYRGSPVVWGASGAISSAAGSHSFAAEAGRHLAPQPLSDGRNVYDALGAGFTLIALDADDDAVLSLEAAAARSRLPLTIIRDSFDGGRERYGSCLILVRPDQFVAWTADELTIPAETLLNRVSGGSVTIPA
jgi:2-polyprenyl-6-methoxyphenol hydroxylase-like FAD-dependent oxidoreductase